MSCSVLRTFSLRQSTDFYKPHILKYKKQVCRSGTARALSRIFDISAFAVEWENGMERNTELGATASEGFFDSIRTEVERRKTRPSALLLDTVVFGLVLAFSRWHMLFGAYPLATAFISAASCEVWIALVAAVIGSLSRGTEGVIHAMISIIVVFLRVLISGGDKKGEERAVFSEPLVLRLAVSLIGAFIGAGYELLLGGASGTSVLYSITSCVSTVLFTVVFYGVFSSELGFFDVVFGTGAVFEKESTGADIYKQISFQASLLGVIFLTSLAVREYVLLGINLDFAVAGLLTLFTAKRFGAVRAMAVGFVATLGTSGIYSVGFALLGVGAGLLFGVGQVYAFAAGGALLGGWSAYMGGLTGFLSTLPEYAVSIAVFFPFLRSLPKEEREEVREDYKRTASDMVASMALSHRNERGGGVDKLSSSVGALSSVIRRFGNNEGGFSLDEIRELIIPTACGACSRCSEYYSCLGKTPAPCAEVIGELAEVIHKNSRITAAELSLLPEYCVNGRYLIDEISREYGEHSRERYKYKYLTALSEEYELMSKLINEARCAEERENALDTVLSEKLEAALVSVGISDGTIKVYGDRAKRFIAAGVDGSGEAISSPELAASIAEISGFKLGAPEFYRKGELALMDVSAAPIYSVEFAKSSAIAAGERVSGDTAQSFISSDSYFYALLSDGAGSGEEARLGSAFVSDFLRGMLSASVSDNTALHALNQIIRQRGEECAATLDLFRFDLLRGEAVFIKSGAATSYVKRENSLFKIRSESAPLGLLKSIDAERIRVECRGGDLIIMLSDGIAGNAEAAAWLPELLSKPFYGSLSEYADMILAAAGEKSRTRDDMTVAVAKIKKIA